MGINSQNVMETINDVEIVINEKFVQILTNVTVDDPIQPFLLQPPFNEDNIFLDNEDAEPPSNNFSSRS